MSPTNIEIVTNTGNLWYPIFAAFLVGVGAALLWTAAGYIAFSYPEEKNKGRFIAMQWGTLSASSNVNYKPLLMVQIVNRWI